MRERKELKEPRYVLNMRKGGRSFFFDTKKFILCLFDGFIWCEDCLKHAEGAFNRAGLKKEGLPGELVLSRKEILELVNEGKV